MASVSKEVLDLAEITGAYAKANATLMALVLKALAKRGLMSSEEILAEILDEPASRLGPLPPEPIEEDEVSDYLEHKALLQVISLVREMLADDEAS